MNNNYYIITEAPTLTPVEKMSLFNTGRRDSNVKAMSDDKLRMNQKICTDNNFNYALWKIEDEMISRGIIPAHSWKALSSNGLGVLDTYIKPENFSGEQFKFIKDNLADPKAIRRDTQDVIITGQNGSPVGSFKAGFATVCAYLYCALLGAPEATLGELKRFLKSDWGYNCTAADAEVIVKHLISEIQNNEAIKTKLARFLNGHITEDLEEAFTGEIEQVIELPDFIDARKEFGLSDTDIESAKEEILQNPNAGDVIQGCHGARKLRIAIAANNKGKSGGARAAYLNYYPDKIAYFIDIIIKSEQEDFTAKQKKQITKTVEAIKDGLL